MMRFVWSLIKVCVFVFVCVCVCVYVEEGEDSRSFAVKSPVHCHAHPLAYTHTHTHTHTHTGKFELLRCQVVCGDAQIPTATISLLNKETNQEIMIAATGTGPVDAAYVAVTKALGVEHIKLLEFAVSSVTAGIDALGEVTVRLEDQTNGKLYYGRSANTDVVVAATQAYLSAINRVALSRGSTPVHPQFGKI